jgi:acyl-homoserine-lactone acylase
MTPSQTLCLHLRFILVAFAAVAAAALGACGNLPVGSRTVQVERTGYGIAHITAQDYEGLAYGTAYAYAQDNVCGVAQQLVTVRGERSQYFGPTATGLLGLRTLPNAQIDLFIRSHMTRARTAPGTATSPPWRRASRRRCGCRCWSHPTGCKTAMTVSG